VSQHVNSKEVPRHTCIERQEEPGKEGVEGCGGKGKKSILKTGIQDLVKPRKVGVWREGIKVFVTGEGGDRKREVGKTCVPWEKVS